VTVFCFISCVKRDQCITNQLWGRGLSWILFNFVKISCQISQRSVIPLPKYRGFSIRVLLPFDIIYHMSVYVFYGRGLWRVRELCYPWPSPTSHRHCVSLAAAEVLLLGSSLFFRHCICNVSSVMLFNSRFNFSIRHIGCPNVY